jgi:hypothetical protein
MPPPARPLPKNWDLGHGPTKLVREVVLGLDRAVAEAVGAPAYRADTSSWRIATAEAGCVAVWKCAYDQFGIVPYKGRVVAWPCALPLIFRDLYVETRCGDVAVPAFALWSERYRRCKRTPPETRTALAAALSHMGFDLGGQPDAHLGPQLGPQLVEPRVRPIGSLCDVYAALLVHHRVVVHGCRYCQLPCDFRHLCEVGRDLQIDACQRSIGPADARARAYFIRMYGTVAVRGARLPGYVVETCRWLRDAERAVSFFECLGLHGKYTARAVAEFLDLEAQAEAERDLALLDLLDGSDEDDGQLQEPWTLGKDAPPESDFTGHDWSL